MNPDLDTMGPIDYLVVEYPSGKLTGEALPYLVDLVDRGVIRILDLTMIAKDPDGTVRRLELSELDDRVRADFSVFEGASSGLLDSDDVGEAANAVEPGSVAGILIYENAWAGPFAAALRRAGAQVIADGRIPVQAILASIEAETRSGADSAV